MRSKKIKMQGYLAAAAAGVSILGTQTAQASSAFYDSFAGSGNLAGSTPDQPFYAGETWSSESSTNTIASPGLAYPASYANAPAVSGNSVTLSSSTVGDHIALNNAPLANGSGLYQTEYYSMLVKVPNTTSLTANGGADGGTDNNSMIAAFSDGTGLSGGSPGTAVAGLYVEQGSAGSGTFTVGVGGGTQRSTGVSLDSQSFAAGTTLFVVVGWTPAAGDSPSSPNGNSTVSLWVNPVLGQTSPSTAIISIAADEAGGFNDGGINSFVLASQSETSGVLVDELRLDGAWANVTPASAPVPEPASLSLLGAGGLLLLRRHRRS